jgi:hypothetical protein
MNQTEMLMRRRVVREFIKSDPVTVTFTRPGAAEATEAGGKVRLPSTTLPDQTARIVQSKRRYDPGLVNSEAGEIPDTTYWLLGNYNLDIMVDDKFTWRGEHYRVVGIHPTRTESVLAAMDFDGPSNA